MTDIRETISLSPKILMTLAQFAGEREWHDDLGAECVGIDDVGPGFLYPGGLWIEKVTDKWSEASRTQGDYYLQLERDEYIGPLEKMEEILFSYACTYGYLDDVKPEPLTFN